MTGMIVFLVGWPFVGAAVAYIAGLKNSRFRDAAACLTAAAELLAAVYCCVLYASDRISGAVVSWEGFCGKGMFFTLDGFRVLYITMAAVMWLVSTIFSVEYMKHYQNKNRYYLFLLVTLGSVMGVFLSADLFTTFIFFEVMSFTSYIWVVQDEKPASMKAGATYLAIAVIGGLVMLMGLFLTEYTLGTLQIDMLRESMQAAQGEKGVLWAAGLCMLFGFGAKAGAVPLHIWLPKAHPVAPAPASALLSGMLTKAGVFGILVLSFRMFAQDMAWGMLILLIGAVTMLTGAVLAIFSIDLKRTLACSSVSQIGFILVGIGMAGIQEGEGSILAARGALLHMVNHSILKLVLFSAAGVVFMNIHRLNLNDIRGFGRKKPWLKAVFLMGALGIGGVPLWNGYVSKTLLHESMIIYQHVGESVWMTMLEWLFLLCGGLTVAYMLKLYIALFTEKNRDAAQQAVFDGKHKYASSATMAAISVPAFVLPIAGILQGSLMEPLADMGQTFLGIEALEESVVYFSLESLSGAGISLVMGGLIYVLIVRKLLMKEECYLDRWHPLLDMENLIYRPVLKLVYTLGSTAARVCDCLLDYVVIGMRKTIYKDTPLPHELDEGSITTHLLGSLLDDSKKALNYTVCRKHPIQISFEHKLAMLRQELSENSTLIGRSLSFGLLLFSVGLIATLLYMIW